jgi:hypothetical protein
MKLRYLAAVVVLVLTAVAAHAQEEKKEQGNVGLYLNPIAIRVSNSNADTDQYAFLGNNSTSNVFYGYNLGGYYNFFHSGSLAAGLDLRFADLHANNAMLRDFIGGIRVSGQPFSRPFKPYIEAGLGNGVTKAPNSTVHIGKLDYAVYGGVDYPLGRHVDFRVFEIGYGSLTTVSTATVGAGGNFPTTGSTLLKFSSGLVFRF